jgi:serine phosphatase RsbU (regulator of sigma subunit)
VLRHLDTFVEQAESARYATVAYADVDPTRGRVDFASAGHPPPVLLDPDGGPALFMGGRSTPLGLTVPDRPREQDDFALPPGSGFLLYTDGLVERRAESIDTGLERLLAALRAHPDATPTDLADAIVEQDTHDDICLLLFRAH